MTQVLSVPEILHRLRLELAKRGDGSIRNLGRCFKINDRDKNNWLSPEEFQQVLGRCGFFLPQHQLSQLCKHFDEDGDGRITYAEFLEGLQGNMNERRTRMVDLAFDSFDTNDDGKITIADLKGKYDASNHPKVLSGELSEEQVLKMFLDSFDGDQVTGNDDGLISQEEFREYYKGISASIPYNDDYFVVMMENAWKIKENDGDGGDAHTNSYLAGIEQILKEKVRQKTKGAESEQITLRKVFRFFDMDDSGKVSLGEFQQALERFGVILPESEAWALFNKYDKDKSGSLDYGEFINAFFK